MYWRSEPCCPSRTIEYSSIQYEASFFSSNVCACIASGNHVVIVIGITSIGIDSDGVVIVDRDVWAVVVAVVVASDIHGSS